VHDFSRSYALTLEVLIYWRFRERHLNVTVETLLLACFIFKLTFGDLRAQVDEWVESFGIGHSASSKVAS